MTDKEIAILLQKARYNTILAKSYIVTRYPQAAGHVSSCSVHIIHHIINSIDWED